MRLLLWLSLLFVPATICAQSLPIAGTAIDGVSSLETRSSVKAVSQSKLSPGAEQVAKLIGVIELFEGLQNLPERERGPGAGMSLEALMLRQQITEAVLTASLEADGVIAEIDSETERLAEIRGLLEARRDRALQINSLATLVASGASGIIGTALQFKDSTANAGNWVSIAGGSFSTVLSLVGIRQQGGGKYALRDSPNMLAPFFEREAEYHTKYPEALWQYLNSPVPTEAEKGTRRERLRQEWIKFGRIDEKANGKGQDKVAFLTSRSSEGRKLTIDLLGDRAAMLADVKVWAELMKRDLSKLMLAMRGR
jgi:hypothetical protein